MSESVFSKIIDTGHNELPPYINVEEFKKVVKSRRSVRVYKTEKIPDEIVRDCLELALLAPSSSNLQPWEFLWVKDETKKAALAAACFNQPSARTAPTLIVCVAHTDTWKRNTKQMLDLFSKNPKTPNSAISYYEKLVPMAMTQGPFGILGWLKCVFAFFVGFFRPIPRGPFGLAALREWAVKSTALACENLMLSFRAHGYDSCPMEGHDESRIKKLLGISRKASVVMVVSAGRRDSNGVYGPQIRFPSEQFIRIL